MALDGRLTYADTGEAIAGAPLRLEVAFPGQRFRSSPAGVTRPDGSFSLRPKMVSTARYRVRFVDDSRVVDATSPTREVRLVR